MHPADFDFLGPNMGPFAKLIIRCAVGGAVPLLVFGIEGKCGELEPNWHAHSGDV